MALWTSRRVAAVSIFALALSAGASWGSQGFIRRDPPVEDPLRLLLRAYARNGEVDYAGVGRDRTLLDQYLASVARVSSDSLDALTKSDQIAFYINVYNACTIDLIVKQMRARGGRLTSIQQIPGAWSRHTWVVAGRKLTLDQIEHDILRERFREPRVHFALVCASRSCPALRPDPFEGPLLQAQLAAAAHAFLLDSTRNLFTPQDGKIRISKIFDWYQGDFVAAAPPDTNLARLYGAKPGALLSFLRPMLPREIWGALRETRVQIEFLPYDWSLNAAGKR